MFSIFDYMRLQIFVSLRRIIVYDQGVFFGLSGSQAFSPPFSLGDNTVPNNEQKLNWFVQGFRSFTRSISPIRFHLSEDVFRVSDGRV